MIFALLGITCVGLILLVYGRWLILEIDQEMTPGWRMAMRLLPFAEVFYLSAGWPRCKKGSLVALLGLALLLPVGGQLVWERLHPYAENTVEKTARGLFASKAKAVRSGVEKGAEEKLLAQKEIKIRELSVWLARWHDSLQRRRDTILEGAQLDMVAFDKETAAYHALNTVAKAEKDDFDRLNAAKQSLAKAAPAAGSVAKN